MALSLASEDVEEAFGEVRISLEEYLASTVVPTDPGLAVFMSLCKSGLDLVTCLE